VYQAFDSLEDFEASIAQLRADHASAAAEVGDDADGGLVDRPATDR
jgi:transcriptional repressor NrdR